MINLSDIEAAVRANGGGWQGYFRRHGDEVWQCILYPRWLLTEANYEELRRRFTVSPHELSAAERKRNQLRYRARLVAEGGKR